MSIIPEGISKLSEAVLSYTITALTILAIVKVFHMFTGGKGLGGLFKGGGKDKGGNTGNTSNTSNTVAPGKKPTLAEKSAARMARDHFDPSNPGKVKFLVCDEDDNPVQGARITVKPKFGRRSRYWALPAAWTPNRDTWREHTLRTNADGFAPSRNAYESIGSGVVTVEVIARGFILLKENYQPSVEILPQEEQVIIITMRGRGEKDDLFEPIVRNVTVEGDVITATGEVV